MLHDLPNEVLIEIFSLLDGTDYINLTTICKKFNNLISNNTQLMKNLFILVRKNHDDSDEWIGTRKYSEVSINKMHKEVPKILKATKNDLVSLSFMEIAIDATELKKILLKCPKLLKLGLTNLNINFDDGWLDEPMPRQDLKNLSCGTDRNILKLFMYSQTKFYCSCRTKSDPGEIESMRNFLKVQTKLEKIHFFRFAHDAEVFNDETLNEVQFRLKQMIIFNMHDIPIENFKKFLKNHQDSLQYMEIQLLPGSLLEQINETEILDCIATFPNLKSLKLYQVLLPTVPMPYVEKLNISFMCYGDSSINWPSKFPNVKDLRISHCQKVAEIIKFKKLETLRLNNNALDEILIPSTVKNLFVFEVWPDYKIPFIFGDHQIENFIAEETQAADWIGDFLKSLKKKLKYLKIRRCFLSRFRRFSRLFEKEPELMNKAERFVFIDWKDDLDEDSIPSEDEEMDDVEDVDCFAGFYQHDPYDEIDWECLAYEERNHEYEDEDDMEYE